MLLQEQRLQARERWIPSLHVHVDGCLGNEPMLLQEQRLQARERWIPSLHVHVDRLRITQSIRVQTRRTVNYQTLLGHFALYLEI